MSRLGIAAVAVVALPLAAQAAPLRVGVKADLRHRLLGEVTVRALAERGIAAKLAPGHSAPVLHAAQTDGRIAVAWESVGIALTLRHDMPVSQAAGLSPDEAVAALRERAADSPVAWPAVAAARGGRVPVVRAAGLRLPTLSQVRDRLAAAAGKRLGVTSGFLGRRDGLAALARAVPQWPVRAVRRLPDHRLFTALRRGRVAAAMLPAGDARTRAPGVRQAAVQHPVFPPHALALAVRRDALTQHPQLRRALEAVAARIDTRALRHLTGTVVHGRLTPAQAAARFIPSTGGE